MSVEVAPEEPTPGGDEPVNGLQIQALRNVESQFLKGQSGNPAGKPPGARNRATMREYARASASVRAALAEAGLDPARNSGLRAFAYGESEVARWPDSPELQRTDAAFIAQDPTLTSRESLAAEAARRAPRFAGHQSPDRWSMSPVDWYAWSLAARPDEASDRE
jgi:hypothetical protein